MVMNCMLEGASDQITYGRLQMSVYIIFLMHQSRAIGSAAISGWWIKKGEFKSSPKKVCFDSKVRTNCGWFISKNGIFVEEIIESWKV